MQQNMMGQNIIITEPSRNLRALGRNALAGKWKLGILAMVVYEVCLYIPPAILNAIFGKSSEPSAGFRFSMGADSAAAASSMAESSLLADLYSILVSGALELGITLFFLALFRKQIVGVVDVFLGFEKFGKALGLMLFQVLFIVLWGLLFIIPGVIAAFRYSQAFFILADDPSKGIRQCVNESKMMMMGNKSKYFWLSLSFIGWLLLTFVALVAYMSVVYIAFWSVPGVVQALILSLAYLLTVPVSVYMYAVYAGFYEILAGHLIKETEPAPIEQIMPQTPAEGPKKDDDFFIPKQM